MHAIEKADIAHHNRSGATLRPIRLRHKTHQDLEAYAELGDGSRDHLTDLR